MMRGVVNVLRYKSAKKREGKKKEISIKVRQRGGTADGRHRRVHEHPAKKARGLCQAYDMAMCQTSRFVVNLLRLLCEFSTL